MGSSASRIMKPTRSTAELMPSEGDAWQETDLSVNNMGPLPMHESNFPRPMRDPSALDDSQAFPLDALDLSMITVKQLIDIFNTAPRLYDSGIKRIVRASHSLVIKGGLEVAPEEAENMRFAAESMSLPVPRVHRVFTGGIPGEIPGEIIMGHFIVMDYIAGPTVEDCWSSLSLDMRDTVAGQVATIIDTMQTSLISNRPPGPFGGTGGRPFEGPWFTHHGAGPFQTLQELEDWCNHKVDVCIHFQQLSPNSPRFRFDGIVLTHQDIAPRNLILDREGKVWLLDWAWAGAYPRGFEQAVLMDQAQNMDFADRVLGMLSDRRQDMMDQYDAIAYGLTTGARL